MEKKLGTDNVDINSEPSSTLATRLNPVLGGLLALVAVAWAAELPYRFGFILYPEQALVMILALGLAMALLGTSDQRTQSSVGWYDWGLAIMGLSTGIYVAVRYPILADEFFFRPVETTVVGTILVLLSVEALRRTTGWSILSVLLIFMTYGLVGHLIPGKLSGRSMEFLELFSFLGVDNTALLGLPLRIISTIVIIFVFMGQLLLRSGGSLFFSDLAASLMGHSRGGSGKVGVFASALFGSISGSAVANVASTGVVTIPLMRKSGYKASVSGALEACASTGGQLMPPVMGAAAFLMAEFLGIPYGDVVLAAIVPSILYYFSVFVQADLEAVREGIGAIEDTEIPPLQKVLREGWYFLVPFLVLMVALFQFNLTPETAGLYAAGSIILLGLVFTYHGSRLRPADVLESLKITGVSSAQVVVIGGAAGMIIGIVDVTGMGFGLTFVLVQFGESSLLLLLALTSLVCIILGMGMPTTAIYFLLATLAAPPMIQLGVMPLAAHMFVLYFGCMSMITPPVALAAFTAANLAQASPMKTAVAAVRFGWPGLVVPFLFVFAPSLLLQGTVFEIARDGITALFGIWLVSAGIIGYLMRPLTFFIRTSLIVGGLALLVPSQIFSLGWILEAFGAVVSVVLVMVEFKKSRA
ncbi:MAG: TRAP transporter fused permease subunit [Acidobacteriota bacterium]|nr:TRAP transporter fused permease subunit [Acidobacteriota bacterium]